MSTIAMTNSLETLAQLYPEIFPPRTPRHHQDQEKPLIWGFECGDGWYTLIHDLCQSIMTHCSTTGDPVPVAVQVKEKYGGLRFYVDDATDHVQKIIDHYERISDGICEVCGEPGTARDDGWLTTRCDLHYKGKQ